ncbi:bifunctional phosphopantothenoylcysteine decarboxylase/phosphopantothenate--cysteine ligase CoaBC [Synechococcus sp. PCC 7336]|uniref:bifunctional phosphopantothenoylcysteine decarboxylase/phosphopantothenate--cysteine ligase CoaBC n=1 Tax=Synechococcus sp. PCC 7336 TaxID=195250 RepID=UPI000345BFEF|nr:bifunctional phosphopantothenoylcysteine decarboxylase/phosphopantothenate--cysteine ligase CoaBC [Synechococcus sp. PCC 7336]
MQNFWPGRRIVIGVCGGIAAYKIGELVSTLAKAGADVKVVLTSSAEQFVTPLTFATLSRQSAHTDADFWHRSAGRPLHIQLADWAEAIVLAPLTANTLGKLAHGLADNLLTNLLLASTCPVLLAPAMNTDMWKQPTVQRNWQQLLADARYWSMNPSSGRLACDAEGPGRLPEPAAIATQLMALLWTKGIPDWTDRRVLVSGGGTREFLDPVRFIGNPSSGKMGWAIARAARDRGAAVSLVHAPLSLAPDANHLDGIATVEVQTAAEMRSHLLEQFPQADFTFMAAAVGDVRPTTRAATKLPKSDLPAQLPLETIPDIVGELSQKQQPRQKLVGFAAQTGDPLPAAIAKLEQKGLDAIVANPIDRPNRGFDSRDNEATVISRDGRQIAIAPCPKLLLAHQLLDFAKTL